MMKAWKIKQDEEEIMMKKVVSLSLVAAMAGSLVACGGGAGDTNTTAETKTRQRPVPRRKKARQRAAARRQRKRLPVKAAALRSA